MTQRRSAIFSCLLLFAFCSPAFGQEGDPAEDMQTEDAVEGGETGEEAIEPDLPPPDMPPGTEDLDAAPAEAAGGEEAGAATPPLTPEQRWKQIVVVPRKSFLKHGRVELMPYFSTTLSDNLIQHFALGGEMNYFLSDILSVGLTARYYFKNVLDEEFYTRYHFKRIPSLNKYLYTVAIQFAYVPFYGKFSIFNDKIVHFEGYASAGMGITGTEIIPRDIENESFTNPASLSFPVALGGRFFLNRWMAINMSFSDLIMLDKYEPVPRPKDPDEAKDAAESRLLLLNMMFNVGVSFFFPADFQYTTFR